MKNLIFLTLFSASTLGCAHVSRVQWKTDMASAKACAEKENKNIFMYVTGSDWCLPCMLLHEHLFEKTDFLKKINKRYVLLLIDFPRTFEISEKKLDANGALAEQYNVRALPEILLLTKDAELFGRMGFMGIAPKDYETILRKFENTRRAPRPRAAGLP
jgi:thioredoxin-related protein